MARRPLPDWPSDDELLSWWPDLGRILDSREQGSGVRLASYAGTVHLKQRPVASIEPEMFVVERLAARGLPVTLPLPTASGGAWQPWDGVAIWIYRDLPGASLDLHRPGGTAHAHLLGEACARLGRALSGIEVAEARDHGVRLRPSQRGCSGLPTQVIHRDFHAGNVLFSDGLVSGYLDFDHLEIGPRVLDLCYAATSLLALMMSGTGPDGWRERWRALVRGYATLVELSDLELERTAELMIANQHDFITWFESRGDVRNVELTAAMIEYVELHAAAVVAAAAGAAGEVRTARERG